MCEFPCWNYVECTGEIPQSRSGHTCALHNGSLFVFGGFDGNECFDDLFCLNLETSVWRKCKPNGDVPSGRASHSAVTDDIIGCMYIFGGSGSHFGYTNKRDLYSFAFETQTWRLLSNPLEDIPSARYGQSMVQYEEGLIVWGGTHGTNYPTDMHRFNLCSKQWEVLVAMGDIPSGRYRHQAMVKEDVMYVVGGSGINRYGDVYLFNFTSNYWSKLMTSGADLSDGRYAHSAVLIGKAIYLYGGNDGVRHDDLLQLDLESKVWSRIQVHGIHTPPGRDFHAAVLMGNESMIIFGGSSNGMRRHNDTYEFRLTARIPPCSLSRDMDTLLEKSQNDKSWQAVSDVFLVPRDGEGLYAHSHILFVRCPHILPVEDQEMFMKIKTDRPTRIFTPKIPSSSDDRMDMGSDREDNYDFKQPPTITRKKIQVDVDCSHLILWNFLHYLYTEELALHLTVTQLFYLYVTAHLYNCVRLAALCERQLKLRLNRECIMTLLQLCESHSNHNNIRPIYDACKHFFVLNYNVCAEYEECEKLDPKLLCELMRMHNHRSLPQRDSGLGGWESFVGNAGFKFAYGHDCFSPTWMPPRSLQDDYRRLLNDQLACDFTIQVQGEIIPVHRSILIARCNYFSSCLLTSGMIEARTHKLVIPTNSSMTAPAFRAFLQFLYGDMPTPKEAHTAMYLIDAASFYGLTNARLKHFCEECVRNSFNEAHVLQLFEASSSLEVETVRTMALDFIVKNFDKIGNQPALYELDKSLLVQILHGLANTRGKPVSSG